MGFKSGRNQLLHGNSDFPLLNTYLAVILNILLTAPSRHWVFFLFFSFFWGVFLFGGGWCGVVGCFFCLFVGFLAFFFFFFFAESLPFLPPPRPSAAPWAIHTIFAFSPCLAFEVEHQATILQSYNPNCYDQVRKLVV